MNLNEDILEDGDLQYYEDYFKKKDEQQRNDNEKDIVRYWKGE